MLPGHVNSRDGNICNSNSRQVLSQSGAETMLESLPARSVSKNENTRVRQSNDRKWLVNAVRVNGERMVMTKGET